MHMEGQPKPPYSHTGANRRYKTAGPLGVVYLAAALPQGVVEIGRHRRSASLVGKGARRWFDGRWEAIGGRWFGGQHSTRRACLLAPVGCRSCL